MTRILLLAFLLAIFSEQVRCAPGDNELNHHGKGNNWGSGDTSTCWSDWTTKTKPTATSDTTTSCDTSITTETPTTTDTPTDTDTPTTTDKPTTTDTDTPTTTDTDTPTTTETTTTTDTPTTTTDTPTTTTTDLPGCPTCSPHNNECGSLTSCEGLGSANHCVCHPGFKSSDTDNQWRVYYPSDYGYLVFVPEGVDCDVECEDWTDSPEGLCGEVPLAGATCTA
ncbi:uncharacterized protein N7503_004040 [Penicillium pulvis]|uniref:uncharacterized protein n=1 Tax=Penicillium pulvis TaxID=1562058 RepID=UPI002547FBF6|nr:uncharacterized protein N7503_004040 [Penicillium pulvis]KAJ5806438.1 hypothetical protein N7503_004040 [Penicillium pulvis]